MGSISGVKLVEIIKNIQSILSIELMTAAQAIEFRKPRKTSIYLENLIIRYRKHVPFTKQDVVLHDLMIKSENFIKDDI